jgi:hypothetical protein
MPTKHFLAGLVAAAIMSLPAAGVAQFTSPNVIATPGDVTTILGSTVFVNHGLVGVGRIPASILDSFGETFGSVSALQITDWASNGNGSYAGTLNIVPDRGYNTTVGGNNFFSDYAARIQRISFVFTPYTGAAPIGGLGVLGKIAHRTRLSLRHRLPG